MEYYDLTMLLLGINDQNMPPFKQDRIARFKSIKKIKDLLIVAKHTRPKVPQNLLELDPTDAEWEDEMNYPEIEYNKFMWWTGGLGLSWFLYAYNYNNYTANLRLRTMRYLFPIVNLSMFAWVYQNYQTQLAKVNLFDEYVQLRARELIDQNKYLLQHDSLKRSVWWFEDFRETLQRVHREGQDNSPTDFRDSEVILQDFIRRHTNPSHTNPLNPSKMQNIML